MASRFDVAVMHDFFVDRLVLTRSLDGLARSIFAKAGEGGGGVHNIAQDEVRGGNAVNLAHALARLGLRTLLITHSTPTHEAMLRDSFKGTRAEVRVKPLAEGLTVAFEERINVMLGDGRGASEFGPSVLEEEDWEGLEGSRVVCSVNWAANKLGTQLLVALRRRLGPEKPIYFDAADFRDRTGQFHSLLLRISKEHLVDWVSMNKVESLTAAKLVGIESSNLGEVCRQLARVLGVVFDIHADKRSFTSEGTRIASAAVTQTKARRLTGAGDVWDAGSIYGRLKGMDEEERLEFANSSARLYLESDQPLAPTVDQVTGSQATSRASSRRSRR